MYSIDIQKNYKCIEELLDGKQSGIILLDAGYVCSDKLVEDLNVLHADITAFVAEKIFSYDTFDGSAAEDKIVIYSDLLCHKSITTILDLMKGCTNASVLVDVTNAGSLDIVLSLFAGDGLEMSLSGLYTPRTLDKMMIDNGYEISAAKDIHSADEASSYLLSEKTLISDYLRYAKGVLDEDRDNKRIIRLYSKLVDANQVNDQIDSKEQTAVMSDKSGENCFLSIIMRTQGKRKLELEEALLSVYGQCDQDYELLLMGHNLDDEGKENVDKIIDETPKDLRDKIRYIDVIGGTRTTPLIRGFEEARGQYVAILDDDDIVFDNWVEVFHNLSKDNNGRILHSYCAKQNWSRIKNPAGGYSLRATGPFEKLYYKDFDEVYQLSSNSCPIHTLAFPKSGYEKLGIRFDEGLNVVEDWDFLMRMSMLTGVANAQAITCIYRIWENSENSASLHAQSEWDEARKTIIGKLSASPVLLSAGVADRISTMVEDVENGTMRKNGESNQLWTFFVDLNDEKGFTADKMIAKYVKTGADGDFELNYEGLSKWGVVKGVRLDPSENSWITIKELEFKVMYTDGTWKNVSVDQLSCNGIHYNNKILFLENDPQIIYAETGELGIEGVSVSGKINYDLDQDARDSITSFLYSKPKNVKKVFGSNKG